MHVYMNAYWYTWWVPCQPSSCTPTSWRNPHLIQWLCRRNATSYLYNTHARTHARTHAHTHTYTHTLSLSRTHARTHAHTHTHTHTQTHTHSPVTKRFEGLPKERTSHTGIAHLASFTPKSSHSFKCGSPFYCLTIKLEAVWNSPSSRNLDLVLLVSPKHRRCLGHNWICFRWSLVDCLSPSEPRGKALGSYLPSASSTKQVGLSRLFYPTMTQSREKDHGSSPILSLTFFPSKNRLLFREIVQFLVFIFTATFQLKHIKKIKIIIIPISN